MVLGLMQSHILLSAAGDNGAAGPGDGSFYVPENPDYSIVDSVVDSFRFTVDKTLTGCDCGHIASVSSFVDPEGNAMGWHDFGHLEGPGWAANAGGGAVGHYAGNTSCEAQAIRHQASRGRTDRPANPADDLTVSARQSQKHPPPRNCCIPLCVTFPEAE